MLKMDLSPRQINEEAARKRTLLERIHQTYLRRDEGKKQYEAWKAACDEWHSHTSFLDRFWSDEFLKLLREGNRGAIEDSIMFLEVDPFYDRSGYLKEKLIRYLKVELLTERDKLRLRAVIWNVARGPNRREFSNFCNLALRVSTKEFEEQIESGLEQYEDSSRGKFSMLLRRLRANRAEA